MQKILLVLALSICCMHASDDSTKIRVSANVLDTKRLKKLNINLPPDTKDGDQIYITATREYHEILIKHGLVNIRYLYHKDGRQERIWNNKIENWE